MQEPCGEMAHGGECGDTLHSSQELTTQSGLALRRSYLLWGKQKEAVASCAVTRTSPQTAQMAPQQEISAAILRTGHGWDMSRWRQPVNQNKTCRTHRGVALGLCISIAKMSSHRLLQCADDSTYTDRASRRKRVSGETGVQLLWTTIVGLQVVRFS